MKSARFADALRLLAEHDVEFIVVGMMAGVLAGAPVTTLDVDIVHRRTEDNVARLLNVLTQLKATYRLDSRGLEPTAANLMGPGHQLLATLYGSRGSSLARGNARREQATRLTLELGII